MNTILIIAVATGIITLVAILNKRRLNRKIINTNDPYELHLEELIKTSRNSKGDIKWSSRNQTKDEYKALTNNNKSWNKK